MLITDDPHLKGNSMILEVLADRTGLDQFEVHFATPKLWGFHHDWILKVTHHPKLDVAWSPNIATLYPQLEASWWVCHTTYHLNSFKLYMSQVYDTYYNMYIYIFIIHILYIFIAILYLYIYIYMGWSTLCAQRKASQTVFLLCFCGRHGLSHTRCSWQLPWLNSVIRGTLVLTKDSVAHGQMDYLRREMNEGNGHCDPLIEITCHTYMFLSCSYHLWE